VTHQHIAALSRRERYASHGFHAEPGLARDSGLLDSRPPPMEISLWPPANIGGLRSQGGVEVLTGGNCAKIARARERLPD
jgi:hypothetical protein